MKIDDRITNYMSLLLADSVNSSPSSRNAANRPKASTPATDSVSISPQAAQLSGDQAHLDRVLAIKRQLSEGTYNISGKDVANKIIKVLKS